MHEVRGNIEQVRSFFPTCWCRGSYSGLQREQHLPLTTEPFLSPHFLSSEHTQCVYSLLHYQAELAIGNGAGNPNSWASRAKLKWAKLPKTAKVGDIV